VEVWQEKIDVTFIITLFTSRAWNVVSSTTTKNIDIAGLISQIEGRCGGSTALYETLGEFTSQHS